MDEQESKKRFDEAVKLIQEHGGPKGQNFVNKVKFLDSILGKTMRNLTINRNDISPFAAMSAVNDPTTIEQLYLPLDTVITGFVHSFIRSIAEAIERLHKGDDEPIIITSAVKEDQPLDIGSYLEGMLGGILLLGLSLEGTQQEAEALFQEILNKQQVKVPPGDVVKATGDPELDSMVKASLLVNHTKKK